MKRVTTAATLIVGLISATSLIGCGGLAKAHMLKHPEAPMMLLENVRALVAVEDPPGSGKLVEFGWVELQKGQTVLWYDWKPIGVNVTPPVRLPPPSQRTEPRPWTVVQARPPLGFMENR